jgi:uncharacterized protein
MSGGSHERVDCLRLADEAASLRREYDLASLPRVRDLLAEGGGTLRAAFDFAKTASGRAGATVRIEAEPRLVCQRCLQAFRLPVAATSEIEFADGEPAPDAEREGYLMEQGSVLLRDLAEEELLLALPFAPACGAPRLCGNAASVATGPVTAEKTTRPFSGLQALFKKT